MPKLTVFTPTYNRAGLLKRGYEALKRQTNKDFLWMIVDDGSTDCTQETVADWIEFTPINFTLHAYNQVVSIYEIINVRLCGSHHLKISSHQF